MTHISNCRSEIPGLIEDGVKSGRFLGYPSGVGVGMGIERISPPRYIPDWYIYIYNRSCSIFVSLYLFVVIWSCIWTYSLVLSQSRSLSLSRCLAFAIWLSLYLEEWVSEGNRLPDMESLPSSSPTNGRDGSRNEGKFPPRGRDGPPPACLAPVANPTHIAYLLINNA